MLTEAATVTVEKDHVRLEADGQALVLHVLNPKRQRSSSKTYPALVPLTTRRIPASNESLLPRNPRHIAMAASSFSHNRAALAAKFQCRASRSPIGPVTCNEKENGEEETHAEALRRREL